MIHFKEYILSEAVNPTRGKKLSSEGKKGKALEAAKALHAGEQLKLDRLVRVAATMNKNPEKYPKWKKRRVAHGLGALGHDTFVNYNERHPTINLVKSVEGGVAGHSQSEVINHETKLAPVTDSSRDFIKTSLSNKVRAVSWSDLPSKYRKKTT